MRKQLTLIFVIIYIVIFIADVFLSVKGQSDSVQIFLEKSSIFMGFVFWVAMLVDYMKRMGVEREFENKLVWGLVVFFGYVLGAFIYFVVIYYPSDKSKDRNESPREKGV